MNVWAPCTVYAHRKHLPLLSDNENSTRNEMGKKKQLQFACYSNMVTSNRHNINRMWNRHRNTHSHTYIHEANVYSNVFQCNSLNLLISSRLSLLSVLPSLSLSLSFSCSAQLTRPPYQFSECCCCFGRCFCCCRFYCCCCHCGGLGLCHANIHTI